MTKLKFFCAAIIILSILLLYPTHSFAGSKVDHGNFIIGWGEPLDRSNFISARLLDDQHTVLFTFNRYIYQPAAGLNAFPDGGYSRAIINKVYIATYDLNRKAVNLLYSENSLKTERNDFYIIGAKGDKVLMRRSGYSWFDLKTGKLTPMPLDKDIRDLGYDAANVDLLDGQGTIVIVNNAAAKPNRHRPEIAVKYFSRKPLPIADSFIQYYGCWQREIYYYKDHKTMAFNLDTHAQRECSRQEYNAMAQGQFAERNNRPLDAVVKFGGDKLILVRKISGQQDEEPLDLSPQSAAPITDYEGLK